MYREGVDGVYWEKEDIRTSEKNRRGEMKWKDLHLMKGTGSGTEKKTKNKNIEEKEMVRKKEMDIKKKNMRMKDMKNEEEGDKEEKKKRIWKRVIK